MSARGARQGLSGIAGVIAAAWVTTALPALAEGNSALAEALFREGRALMDKGDYVAACPKLAESHAQEPATGTLLALGRCNEQAGKLATAWVHYNDALQRARREGRADREQAVKEQLDILTPRLSYLTISVDGSSADHRSLQLKRDGAPVGPAAWGTAVPIDGGSYVVEATAPGKKPFRTRVEVAKEADKQTVRVPILEAEAPSAAPPGRVPLVGASTADASTGAARMPPLRLAGLIVGGAGVVSLGFSAFFGLRASSLNGESKDLGCRDDNRCPPDALEKRNDAVDASTLATMTLIGGGVLAATGATLFLVGGKSSSEAQAKVSASPMLGWGSAGLVLRGNL